MCWAVQELQGWKAWRSRTISGEPPRVKKIQFLNAEGRVTQQNVIATTTPTPAALPPGVTSEMLHCEEKTSYLHSDCGHVQTVPCSRAYWQKVGPCVETIERICGQLNCQHRRLILCHKRGEVEPCTNKVPKLCQLCLVNHTDAACCQTDTKCNRQVIADLCCGHKVKWQCGAELDPRTRGDKAVDFCLLCVAPRWQHYIEGILPANAYPDCWQPLRQMVDAQVQTVKVVTMLQLNGEIQLHIDARSRISRAVLDALNADPTVPVELPPTTRFLSPPTSNSNFNHVPNPYPKLKLALTLLTLRPKSFR
jgi:hypothetical protein